MGTPKATATPNTSISYIMTEGGLNPTDIASATVGSFEQSNVGYVSDAMFGTNTLVLEHGNYTGQVNMGIALSGSLPSGGTLGFDFSALEKPVFGKSMSVGFAQRNISTPTAGSGNRVRSITIVNRWNGSGNNGFAGLEPTNLPYLTVAAIGGSGFSGLFNGESGNIRIRPHSSWSFTDYIGVYPIMSGAPEQYSLTLIDSGSGVPYEMVVVGVTGITVA